MFRKSNSRERPQNVCDRVADLLGLIHTKFSPLSLDILKKICTLSDDCCDRFILINIIRVRCFELK